MIKVVFIIVLIAVTGLVFIIFNPVNALVCTIQGGSYERKQYFSGMGEYYCVVEYSDANKSCTSSDQCQGDCMIDRINTKYDENGKATKVAGVCSTTNRYNGCFGGTIESPLEGCE